MKPTRREAGMIQAAAPTFPDSIEGLACDVEISAAATGDPTKRPTFAMVAYDGNPMRVNAWMDPIALDFAGMKWAAKIPIARDHDMGRLVGHATAIEVVDGKLKLSGEISFENGDAQDVISSSRNGFPWQASVGVTPASKPGAIQRLRQGESAEVNGKTVHGPIAIVRASVLKEVSFVGLGASGGTSAKVAASATKGNAMKRRLNATTGKYEELHEETGEWVEAADQSAANSNPGPRDEASALDDVFAAADREQARKNQITAIMRNALSEPGANIELLREISAKAIKDGWSVNDTELAVLRASRASAPAIHSRNEPAPSNDILAASMLMALGMPHDKLEKDPDFGPRVCEAAWKRSRGQMSLHELISVALRANGVEPGVGGRQIFDSLVAAAPLLKLRQAGDSSDIRANFSTVNLAGILGTVGNKLLLDSFTAVATTYQEICQLSDFNNFLTYTQYRMTATGGFRKVAGNGELKHLALGEESYTNRLETQGALVTLTRQQIINDDLGALQQIYRIMGRDAALALEEAVYDAFMESSDVIFTTARGNKLTSSALSLTTLQAADAALQGMVNENGKPIYAMGSRLVVPPSLRALADSLYISENIVSGSSSGLPEANTMRGRMKPVSSPFLSLAALAGSSASTWYLFADPAMIPFLQAAFLRGQRAPTVDSSSTNFDTLGMTMRGFLDFGVTVVDYRGANKNLA